jgi:SAM-dependent methyltransferase
MGGTVAPPRPDLRAIKRRQRQTWEAGDAAAIGTLLLPVADGLCDRADLEAGWHVLDVATGTGNGAIAAARLGACAVGVDYVPASLERGRARAEVEGLDVTLVEGDVESLPFAEGTFDAVTSVFGAMFAPDHRRAASEILRVCRPGGTIALASWTPDGFVGELFRVVSWHAPSPAGVPSAMLWGTEPYLRSLFGAGVASPDVRERTFTFRFSTADELVAFLRRWYGPTRGAFAALERAGREELRRDLVSLVRRFDRLGGDAIAVPAVYAEAIAVRR